MPLTAACTARALARTCHPRAQAAEHHRAVPGQWQHGAPPVVASWRRPAAPGGAPPPPPPHWQQRQQQRLQRVLARAATSTDGAAVEEGLVTFEEVQQIAASRGLEISLKTLGPAYRIVCRDAAPPAAAPAGTRARRPSSAELAAEEAGAGVGGAGRVLAVTSGFLVPPLRLMHCDTLQVFTRGLTGAEGQRSRGGVLGLGLLIGAATFAFGLAAGCRKAEILAINDDDAWHERLVGYYSRFGFVPVRAVRGDTLGDLPHMLVWGGAGTRMDADVEGMLRRWTRAVRRNSAAAVVAAGGAAGGPDAAAAAAAAAQASTDS